MRKRPGVAKSKRRPGRRSHRRKSSWTKREFAALIEGIEATVQACISLRRWQELEAEIAFCAEMSGVDATRILGHALREMMTRRQQTLTDPQQIAECAESVAASHELAESGMPLQEAVQMLRVSTEHRHALLMYNGIVGVWSQEKLH